MNKHAESYSQILTGGAVNIQFRNQTELKSGKTTERFEVAVENDNGAGSYRGCSAGERARIDLCVGLALQGLLINLSRAQVNVAFWDEPLESLDSTAHERVIELLSSLNRESVFVITHDEGLKSYFPHSLEVARVNGASVIQ